MYGSPGWIRTSNPAVNSRVLHRWATEDYIEIRQRPTLPGGHPPSTIGAEGLNFCVRYENRCFPFAIATGNCYLGLHLQNCTMDILDQALDLLVPVS